jgi:hypothetical protein
MRKFMWDVFRINYGVVRNNKKGSWRNYKTPKALLVLPQQSGCQIYRWFNVFINVPHKKSDVWKLKREQF